MAVDNKIVEFSHLNAGEDLSDSQYKCVQLNSSGLVMDMDAITNPPLGILQNAPITGEPCRIVPPGCGGISKFSMGATVATGALASSRSDGKATGTASTDYNLGMMMKGGVSGDIGEILLSTLPLTV